VISVVIPTIRGREHHLRRCVDAYRTTAEEMPVELIEIHNRPTCGEAWAEGGAQATGDYIHFSADDLEPHPGWWKPAIECVKTGKLPCPRILKPDGTLESCGQWGTEMEDGVETNIARIPLLSRAQWEQGGWTIDQHYYTDNWVWHRGQELGYPTVVCRDYLFTHYYAAEGRLETIDDDWQLYVEAGGQF